MKPSTRKIKALVRVMLEDGAAFEPASDAVLVTGMVMNCETCEEIDDKDPGELLELNDGLDAIIRSVCPDAPG